MLGAWRLKVLQMTTNGRDPGIRVGSPTVLTNTGSAMSSADCYSPSVKEDIHKWRVLVNPKGRPKAFPEEGRGAARDGSGHGG